MWKRTIVYPIVFSLFLGAPLWSQSRGSRKKPPPEKNRYQEWMVKDVAYIITPEEKEVFRRLGTDEEREQFIEQFWLKRDPDPLTFANEYKEEHYRRIAYVNAYYGSGIPGWKTDRGRIYILYGQPTQVESNPSGGSYERPRSEGGGRTSTFPFEVWHYKHLDGIGDDIRVEFVDKSLTGQYTIASDPSEKDALLRVPGLGKTLLEEAGVASKTDRVLGVNQQETVLQMGRSWKDQSFERLIQSANLNRPPEIKFKELQQAVQARVIYRDIPIRLSWDYIWVDERKVLVPLTMVVPSTSLTFRTDPDGKTKTSSLQYYGRVIHLGGRIVQEFEQDLTFQPSDRAGGFVILRQILLPPGRYRLELVLKDMFSNKIGFSETGLAFTNQQQEQIKISSLIFTHKIEILSEAPTEMDAAVIGDLRIHPSIDATFQGKSNLGVYFQVTASEQLLSEQIPVEIRYRILKDQKIIEEIADQEGITIHRRNVGRIIAFAFLSLSKLPAGQYILSIAVKVSDQNPVTATKLFQVRS